MRKIVIFGEDFGHEVVIKALVERFAELRGIDIDIRTLSVRGGHGEVLNELRQFFRDLEHSRINLPDLIIVAIDSNCNSVQSRRREIESKVPSQFLDFVICAVPDPHVERWLLIDSAAFRTVLRKGCAAPDDKCDKDRYKQLLANAVKDAGVRPYLGGMEHAESIVNAMDLVKVGLRDRPSFGKLLRDIRRKFNQWQQSTSETNS